MPISDDWAVRGITIVEDEPAVRDVLLLATRSWNYDCQSADSAEQGLVLLEHRATPIIITDLRMPGRGGLWLIRQVRKRWPESAIIVLTAGEEEQSARESLAAGADHYFIKPVRLEELHHVLEATRQAYFSRHAINLYRQRLEETVKRQTRRVRRMYLSGVTSLVRAMEERDPCTAGHSLRVRTYALWLARTLRLSPRLQKHLGLAAKLHDIGKVGIPEAILNKPGSLTPAECVVVQRHPVIGERILRPIIRNREVLAAIRSHHERLDGAGYPDGLRGSTIPLLARLISVVDCFDALVSARAYRVPLSTHEALEVLRTGAGKQFEPEFVSAFVHLVKTQTPPLHSRETLYSGPHRTLHV